MSQIELEKKARAASRTSFTRIKNQITTAIEASAPNLRALVKVFEDRFDEISRRDASIQELMMLDPNVSEMDMIEDQKKSDEYNLVYAEFKIKVSQLLDDDSQSKKSGTTVYSDTNANICKYKLPALKLKEFDGDLSNWLPFWSQFKKIHEDSSLDPADKFQYLTMNMVQGSSARQLVDSYPSTAEMYPDVIKALTDRFGREDLLTEFYIRELLKMVINNITSTKKMSISMLHDQIQCHLRNLETLDVTADKCAPILFPLVSSSLPEDLLKVWERNCARHTKETNTNLSSKDYLENLLSFLRSEVEGGQKVRLALSGFGIAEGDVRDKSRKSEDKIIEKSFTPTAADLLSTAKKEVGGCIFCSYKHRPQDCVKAQTMTISERRDVVYQKKVCFSCLKPSHTAKSCQNKPRCIICGRSHFVLLCDKITPVSKPSDMDTTRSDETLTSLASTCNVLLQTLIVQVRSKFGSRKIRALIDTGSQKSYILDSTAAELKLEASRQELLQHSVFGGTKTEVVKHNIFVIHISDLNDQYRCNFEVLGQQVICGKIPSAGSNHVMTELLQRGIELSDIHSKAPIELLIGADIAGKLLTGQKQLLGSGLVAIETKLGWTLMGKIREVSVKENSALLVTSMLTMEKTISDLWALDSLGITDPLEKQSKAEIEFLTRQHFRDTVSIDKDGRFEVRLPWVASHPPLPSNYDLALKRLDSTIRRLRKEGYYEVYQNVFDEWMHEGVIEFVPNDQIGPVGRNCHYVPHRHIVKASSTTPVRPVFDASARENKNCSLNQCLEKGPNLLQKIPSVLAHFRAGKVGVVGDIRRAFLQISLHSTDRDYFRFLWIPQSGKLTEYRHCRVVFGASPSPFLLEASIELLIETTIEMCKKGDKPYPVVWVELLLKSFYVDNCVVSLDNQEEAEEFVSMAVEIMNQRLFELRGWELSLPQIDSTDFTTAPLTNVLGILWNRRTDTLEINLESLNSLNVEKVTKKVMLSAAHRLFDPIGFSCGVSLVPKIMIQQTWKTGLAWEDEVDDVIRAQFLKWLKEVKCLSEVKIPRWLTGSKVFVDSKDLWSLHVFADACQTSYAAVVFLRVEFKDHVRIELVSAKARVAPTNKPGKGLTIPRLELLSALIASRLYATVCKDYEFQDVKTFFYTDSTNSLAWIVRNESWDVFVQNRVREIRELTQAAEWRHIPGSLNPADLISRGCSAKKLLESRWWEGPSWLKQSPSYWPRSQPQFDENEINSEKKKTVVSAIVNPIVDASWYYKNLSTFKKIVRMIGWIYRWKKNCEIEKANRDNRILSAEEYNFSEKKVITLVQSEAFSDIFDPKISKLHPFYDSDGIIRIMSKISNRPDTPNFRHPVILPKSDHRVVSLLILDIHQEHCHAGTQVVQSILREKYWVLGGRRSVKIALSQCLTCQKHSVQRIESVPPPLPENRVRDARCFEVVGVDMAGPLYLKVSDGSKQKAWICLFTCAIYRAVHLELASSISTDSFLQCFRRFINRRGRPNVVYCDNGTNFVGAFNACKKLDWDMIAEYSSVRKIEWRFSPPSSPWWGGWWERLIGLMKTLLRKVLGRASVTYEEMITILTDCESVVNSRPLTYISQDPSDLIPLTPKLFLQDIEEVGVPDFNLIEATDINKRLQYRQNLRMALHQRFRSEYLGQLQRIAGERPIKTLRIDDIVLIGNDCSRRMDWPLGRVTELIAGKDGEVRVVKLKTATGELTRPVQRIYPLELDLTGSNDKIRQRLQDEVALGTFKDPNTGLRRSSRLRKKKASGTSQQE